MRQDALTVVTKIKQDRMESLDQLLDVIQKETRKGDVIKNPRVPFKTIGTTCFAAWIVLKDDIPSTPDGGDGQANEPLDEASRNSDEQNSYGPMLVFECNYEGNRDNYLNEFLNQAGPTLHEIYSHCEGYEASTQNNAYINKYLLTHHEGYSAFFVGCPKQSQPGILKSIEARAEIESFLGAGATNGKSPGEIHNDINQHLHGKRLDSFPGLTSLTKLKVRAFLSFHALWFLPLLPYAVAWILRFFSIQIFPAWLLWTWTALIALVVLFLLVWIVRVRIAEIRESRLPEPKPRRIDPMLFKSEDEFTQNHLTTVVELKPGALRLHSMRGVLWVLNFVGKWIYITGHLGGIPLLNGHKGGIPTIHFARWLIINKDHKVPRLLFLSNFDGSWHSYLGDFVDRGWFGLNAVWGNTVGFPPTRYLFWAGAKRIIDFKQWSREHNCYANVWFTAYPHHSLRNILTNIRITETIGKRVDHEQARRWLRLFG